MRTTTIVGVVVSTLAEREDANPPPRGFRIWRKELRAEVVVPPPLSDLLGERNDALEQRPQPRVFGQGAGFAVAPERPLALGR